MWRHPLYLLLWALCTWACICQSAGNLYFPKAPTCYLAHNMHHRALKKGLVSPEPCAVSQSVTEFEKKCLQKWCYCDACCCQLFFFTFCLSTFSLSLPSSRSLALTFTQKLSVQPSCSSVKPSLLPCCLEWVFLQQHASCLPMSHRS